MAKTQLNLSGDALGFGFEPPNVSTMPAKNSNSPRTSDASQKVLSVIAALGEGINQHSLAELHSLSRETDEELFYEGLLHFGVRLKSRNEFEKAAVVFSLLSGGGGERVIPRDIRRRAEEEYHSIVGKGDIGKRLEVLTARLGQDCRDWRMIAPMIGASVIGSTVGASVLSRLVANPSANLFTRGIGARLTAGFVGFLAEFPAFAALGRAVSPHAEGSFVDDLERSALSLGALKAFGIVGNKLLKKFHGFNELGIATRFQSLLPVSQILVPQTSIFFGLLASHKLEEKAHLREHVDGATFVTDILASLFTMSVGSHLGHTVMGEGFARFQRELHLRGDALRISECGMRNRGSAVKGKDVIFIPQSAIRNPQLAVPHPALHPLLAPMWAMMGIGIGGGPGGPKRGKKGDAVPPTLRSHTDPAEEMAGRPLQGFTGVEALLPQIPTNKQISNEKVPPPVVNPLGLPHSRDAILDQWVKAGTRFVEVGYGHRLETLKEAEARGARAWGLELYQTYPPGLTPEQVLAEPPDVVFLNQQNPAYFKGPRVNFPVLRDLLGHVATSKIAIIQSYDPRSPLEILRHTENLHGVKFRVVYYQGRPSAEAAPLFATDWGTHEGLFNTVLVAERLGPPPVRVEVLERTSPAEALRRQSNSPDSLLASSPNSSAVSVDPKFISEISKLDQQVELLPDSNPFKQELTEELAAIRQASVVAGQESQVWQRVLQAEQKLGPAWSAALAHRVFVLGGAIAELAEEAGAPALAERVSDFLRHPPQPDDVYEYPKNAVGSWTTLFFDVVLGAAQGKWNKISDQPFPRPLAQTLISPLGHIFRLDLLHQPLSPQVLREYLQEVLYFYRDFPPLSPNETLRLEPEDVALNRNLLQRSTLQAEAYIKTITQNLRGMRKLFGAETGLLFHRYYRLLAEMRDAKGQANGFFLALERGQHEFANGLRLAIFPNDPRYLHPNSYLAKVGLHLEGDSLRIVNIQGATREFFTESQKGEPVEVQRLQSELGDANPLDMLVASAIMWGRSLGFKKMEGIRDAAQLSRGKEMVGKIDRGFYDLIFRKFGFNPPREASEDWWSLALQELEIYRKKAAAEPKVLSPEKYISQVLVRKNRDEAGKNIRPEKWDRQPGDPQNQSVIAFWRQMLQALKVLEWRPQRVRSEDPEMEIENLKPFATIDLRVRTGREESDLVFPVEETVAPSSQEGELFARVRSAPIQPFILAHARRLFSSLSFADELMGRAAAQGRTLKMENEVHILQHFLLGEFSQEPRLSEIQELQEVLRSTERGKLVADAIVNRGRPIFQIYTKEFLDAMAADLETRIHEFRMTHQRDPVLVEIAAGDGRLTRALNRRLKKWDIPIRATDIHDPRLGIKFPSDVEKLDATQAAEQGDILLGAWWPPGASFDGEVVKILQAHPGKVLLLMGEGFLGENHSDEFWQEVTRMKLEEPEALNQTPEGQNLNTSGNSLFAPDEQTKVRVLRARDEDSPPSSTPLPTGGAAASEKGNIQHFPLDLQGYSIWRRAMESRDPTLRVFRDVERSDLFHTEGYGFATFKGAKGWVRGFGYSYCSRLMIFDPKSGIVVDSHLPVFYDDLEVFYADLQKFLKHLEGQGVDLKGAKIDLIYGKEIIPPNLQAPGEFLSKLTAQLGLKLNSIRPTYDSHEQFDYNLETGEIVFAGLMARRPPEKAEKGGSGGIGPLAAIGVGLTTLLTSKISEAAEGASAISQGNLTPWIFAGVAAAVGLGIGAYRWYQQRRVGKAWRPSLNGFSLPLSEKERSLLKEFYGRRPVPQILSREDWLRLEKRFVRKAFSYDRRTDFASTIFPEHYRLLMRIHGHIQDLQTGRALKKGRDEVLDPPPPLAWTRKLPSGRKNERNFGAAALLSNFGGEENPFDHLALDSPTVWILGGLALAGVYGVYRGYQWFKERGAPSASRLKIASTKEEPSPLPEGWVRGQRRLLMKLANKPHGDFVLKNDALVDLGYQLSTSSLTSAQVTEGSHLMWDLAHEAKVEPETREWIFYDYLALLRDDEKFPPGAPQVYREALRLRRIFSEEKLPDKKRVNAAEAYDSLVSRLDPTSPLGKGEAKQAKAALQALFLETRYKLDKHQYDAVRRSLKSLQAFFNRADWDDDVG